MMKLAVQKERPPMPDKILPEIKELIEACWQHDAKDRPTSEEVLFKLENFVYAKYWPNKWLSVHVYVDQLDTFV